MDGKFYFYVGTADLTVKTIVQSFQSGMIFIQMNCWTQGITLAA